MEFSSHYAIFKWKPSCLLSLGGEDAGAFLQGQFSNDLRGVEGGQSAYGLWLNQKGKVVADSFVGRWGGGRFWVTSYFSPSDQVKQRLEDYIIADDVEISDLTASWSGVSLIGDGSGAWLKSAERVGITFPGRRSREENWEWIFPDSDQAAVWAQLKGGREIDGFEIARRRIEAVIPAVPDDIGFGDLPAEGRLEASAISYTKGCYLGQEVMARLKSMGQVRRRLRRVQGRGEVPSVPAKLIQDQKPIGELRSVAPSEAGFVGLAMVSLVNFKEGLPVLLEGADSKLIQIISETT